MPSGVYKHYSGKSSPRWKNGKPNCKDCGKKLKDYKNKRCKNCYIKWRVENPNCKQGFQKGHPDYRTEQGMAKAKAYLSKIAKEQRGEKHHNWKGGVKNDQEYMRRYRREWKRNNFKKLKDIVIEKYGGKCECCGEEIKEFLTIEHKKHNGKEHRTKMQNTHNLYRQVAVRKTDYEEYGILCMNCNFATRYGNKCPHKNFFKTTIKMKKHNKGVTNI